MSDTNPSERMTSAFASLIQSSKNINDASNELAQPIASLEKSLKRLNLGVTCWTQISSAGDGDTYFLREVGYAELQDRWCVALRTRRGRECDPESETTLVWPFNEAPRYLRVKAVDALPDLIEALVKTTDATTERIKAKVSPAHELAGAVGIARAKK